MGNDIIDIQELKRVQEVFCNATHLYLACLDRDGNCLAGMFGKKEEKDFFQTFADQQVQAELAAKMRNNRIENTMEYETGCDYVKCCALSVCVEEKPQAVWIVMGVLKDRLPENKQLPEGIMVTTGELFFQSVSLLSVLSDILLECRYHCVQIESSLGTQLEKQKQEELQLKNTGVMMEILKMLESDNSFEKMVDDILKMACDNLGIAGGCLLRDNSDGTVELLCGYARDTSAAGMEYFENEQRGNLPFFDGKPYIVSADSVKPEAFEELFESWKISAGIFEPLKINGKVVMYLCFYDTAEYKIWENADIRFVSDTRRVIQNSLVKRVAKNSLAGSYTSLQAILENVGCGIYVADYKSRSILYMNRKLKELFAKSVAGNGLEEMIFSEKEVERSQYFEEYYSAVEERWMDARKTEIDWVDGRRVSLGTFYDITDKKKYQKKIENQVNNDFLTGLFNRMRCEEDLKRFIRGAKKNDETGALLYLDLDDFKHINDGLGHQYGDVLLKAISHSLQKIRGVDGTCYRMGGDEFIVIVPPSFYMELNRIVKEVISIFSRPWFLKGEDYYCTMSMGIVYFPTDADTVDELIRKADIALMSAKKRGKNRVEYYDEMDASSTYRRLDLEKNMRTATMNACSEFEVYYQPIVNAQDPKNSCCGAEALVRWNSSALGFISPVDFIPLAEYLGLINPIGEHVLKNAALRCKYWNDMGHPEYHVNVNLSVVQLLQNDIVKKIATTLKETRINPRNLTLEVTESLAINDMSRMKKILSEIRELGVRVALDDFGTGYSSLNHIREMPLDVIKIDRCFIEHIGEDDFSDAFVKMVAELARTIGVRICVEGVETKKQRDVVKRMGISMIQGYLYGKPMPIEEFEEKYL